MRCTVATFTAIFLQSSHSCTLWQGPGAEALGANASPTFKAAQVLQGLSAQTVLQGLQVFPPSASCVLCVHGPLLGKYGCKVRCCGLGAGVRRLFGLGAALVYAGPGARSLCSSLSALSGSVPPLLGKPSAIAACMALLYSLALRSSEEDRPCQGL